MKKLVLFTLLMLSVFAFGQDRVIRRAASGGSGGGVPETEPTQFATNATPALVIKSGATVTNLSVASLTLTGNVSGGGNNLSGIGTISANSYYNGAWAGQTVLVSGAGQDITESSLISVTELNYLNGLSQNIANKFVDVDNNDSAALYHDGTKPMTGNLDMDSYDIDNLASMNASGNITANSFVFGFGAGSQSTVIVDASGNSSIDTDTDLIQIRNTGASGDGDFLIYTNGGWSIADISTVVPAVADDFELVVACSDETTALTTGTAKATFRMPRGVTLTEVRASVGTAPTGATVTVDINESGATILSTKLTIDASEKTSTTAATAPVISDSSLADDAEITIDIDQVGSTVAGAGLKVTLIGNRN